MSYTYHDGRVDWEEVARLVWRILRSIGRVAAIIMHACVMILLAIFFGGIKGATRVNVNGRSKSD